MGYADGTTRGDNASEMGTNLAYVDLGVNIDVLKIYTGFHHSCAILDNKITLKIDNLIRCWGRNDAGQLGQGTTANQGDGTTEMGDNLSLTDIGRSSRAINDPSFLVLPFPKLP